MPPPVSLLVPAYNAEAYLPRLVESMRRQTTPFTEWLLCDDASSDRTAGLAAELGFRVLQNPANLGPAGTRNRLLAAATCPWIHFQDADDLLEPDFLACLAEATGEADVVACQMNWTAEDTGRLEIAWRYDQAALEADAVSAAIRTPIGVICCLYRAATLRAIGGFDEGFRGWEDADLGVRMAAAGARFTIVPQVLARGIRHGRGASSDRRMMWESRTRLLERYAVDYPHAAETIGAVAEELAAYLLGSGRDPDLADRAIKVCQRTGRAVPTTGHPALRLARAVLPAGVLMRLQAARRRFGDPRPQS